MPRRRESTHIVEVGDKPVARREAVAEGALRMSPEALAAIAEGALPKGDALTVAETAGLLAAKSTPHLLPLCHPVSFTAATVTVSCDAGLPGVRVRATIGGTGSTGFEMEALVAASVALLTVYDMAKALDPGMVITEVAVQRKSGGKSGTWVREAE
jgi:cyclic pyranopterin monophosphate synthase